MEMDTRRLVAQLVSKMHGDLFAYIGANCWGWPFIVDSYDRSFKKSIRVAIDPGDIPVVDSSRYVNAVDYREGEGGYWQHHGNELK